MKFLNLSPVGEWIKGSGIGKLRCGEREREVDEGSWCGWMKKEVGKYN